MIRFLLAALLLLVPVVTRAQSLVASGQITWGLAATFPPFEYVEDGKPVGFDIDLADALAKKLALTSTVTTFEFKGLIPALLGKRVDAIISGMYINADRQAVADFVPYVRVGNQIVVRHANPLGLSDPASLCGHRVAAPVGTTFEMAANKALGACVAAGKPALTLLSLPGTTTCALALTQDRADAIIVSTPTAASLLHTTPDAYANAGVPYDNNTEVGIAIGKDNPALKAALDKAMHDVVADGTYAALLAKWNLPADSSAF
jgi:polar amino acid transport system substrate-binding protein